MTPKNDFVLKNNGMTLITVGCGLLTDPNNLKLGVIYIGIGIGLILMEGFLQWRSRQNSTSSE